MAADPKTEEQRLAKIRKAKHLGFVSHLVASKKSKEDTKALYDTYKVKDAKREKRFNDTVKIITG